MEGGFRVFLVLSLCGAKLLASRSVRFVSERTAVAVHWTEEWVDPRTAVAVHWTEEWVDPRTAVAVHWTEEWVDPRAGLRVKSKLIETRRNE
jgi:hypothetical protein